MTYFSAYPKYVRDFRTYSYRPYLPSSSHGVIATNNIAQTVFNNHPSMKQAIYQQHQVFPLPLVQPPAQRSVDSEKFFLGNNQHLISQERTLCVEVLKEQPKFLEQPYPEYKLFSQRSIFDPLNFTQFLSDLKLHQDATQEIVSPISPTFLESKILELDINCINFLKNWHKLYLDYRNSFNAIHISSMLNKLMLFIKNGRKENKKIDDQTEEIFNSLIRQLESFLSFAQTRELSTISTIFVKLNRKDPKFFCAVAKSSLDRLSEFNHVDLALLAWSFARLEINDSELLTKLFEKLQLCVGKKINTLNNQDLTNIIDAFCRYGLIDQSLLDSLLERSALIINKFNIKELKIIFYSLLNFSQCSQGYYTLSEAPLKAITSRLKQLEASFNVDRIFC